MSLTLNLHDSHLKVNVLTGELVERKENSFKAQQLENMGILSGFIQQIHLLVGVFCVCCVHVCMFACLYTHVCGDV